MFHRSLNVSLIKFNETMIIALFISIYLSQIKQYTLTDSEMVHINIYVTPPID